MARLENLGSLYWRVCVWAGGLSAAIWFAVGMTGLMLDFGEGDFLRRAAGSQILAFAAVSAIFAGLGASRAAVGRGDAAGGALLAASSVVAAAGFGAAAVDIWIDWGDFAWNMTRLALTSVGVGAFGFHGAALGLIGARGVRGWIMAQGARLAGGCALGAALFALWSAAGPLTEWFGLIMIGLVIGYAVTAGFCAMQIVIIDMTPAYGDYDLRGVFGIYIASMLIFCALWIFLLGCAMEAGAARFAIGAGAICAMMTIGVWIARELDIRGERMAERERKRKLRRGGG